MNRAIEFTKLEVEEFARAQRLGTRFAADWAFSEDSDAGPKAVTNGEVIVGAILDQLRLLGRADPAVADRVRTVLSIGEGDREHSGKYSILNRARKVYRSNIRAAKRASRHRNWFLKPLVVVYFALGLHRSSILNRAQSRK